MEASLGIILSLLSATATAIWTVWTFNEQKEDETKQKRDQIAALYVNPFLVAAHDLQIRIEQLIKEGELKFFKREYPENYEVGSVEALEFLYTLVKFFGWYWCVYRYSPYSRDREAIRLIAKIIATFADCRNFEGQAFYFSFPEQKSLGQRLLHLFGETVSGYPQFEAISFYQFAKEIKNDLQQDRPLYQNVIKMIEAFDEVEEAEKLKGRDRLLIVHDQLIDLLDYLETQEGFSVSAKIRRKVKHLVTLPEDIEVIHAISGRLRLRIPRLRQDESYRENLGQKLQALAGIEGVNVNSQAASVAISYIPTLSEAVLKERIFALIGELN